MCASALSSAFDQGRLTRNATTAARTEPTTCRRRRAPPAATPAHSRDGWRRRRDPRRGDLGSAPKGAHRTAERWTAFLASFFEAFAGECPWTRIPSAGNSLAEANRSAKSSPAGSARQRPSTNHSTPVRARPVRAKTSDSIALRDPRNPATLHVGRGSSSPLLRSHPSDRSHVLGGSGERCNRLPGVSSRIPCKALGMSCNLQVCSIAPRHAICGKQ